MDILILNWKDITNPEVGGAEVIAFEFARRLVRDGHEVTFFSRTYKNCLPEETIDGVRIVRRGNKFSVYFKAFMYYKILNKKPDRVIDMVNTLCWQTPLYVPREKRVAYVNQLAREVLFYELPLPLSVIAYVLERIEYLPYHRTKFLCYSESTKKDLMSFGINRDAIHTFPLGLDHKRYTKYKKKSPTPSFIFVARLVRMKRADLCIHAMALVAKQHPQTKLFIVGNGPDESRIKNLIEKYRLNKNVVLVNKNNFYIDKNPVDVKVQYMQEAWALLLPSVKEGWGMVVTEAAACGTPSIVSDVTGLRDSVLAGKTGTVLSKSPSASELASAMEEIITNQNLRKALTKGSLTWSREFNWDISYESFKRLIIQA